MPDQMSRRETLRRGLAATSMLALLRELPVPALAQGDTDVPFTDLPNNFNPAGVPGAATRQLDIRKIDGMLTPKDQFFTTQHFTKPEIDPAAYRLKFTGMVLPSAKVVSYAIDLKRVVMRRLVIGIADGVMKVDGQTIYEAKDLRVGLFVNGGNPAAA